MFKAVQDSDGFSSSMESSHYPLLFLVIYSSRTYHRKERRLGGRPKKCISFLSCECKRLAGRARSRGLWRKLIGSSQAGILCPTCVLPHCPKIRICFCLTFAIALLYAVWNNDWPPKLGLVVVAVAIQVGLWWDKKQELIAEANSSTSTTSEQARVKDGKITSTMVKPVGLE